MVVENLLSELKQATPKRIFRKEEPGNIVTYTGGLDNYTVTVMIKEIIDNSTIPPLEDYELVLFKVYDEFNTEVETNNLTEQSKLDIGFKLMNSKLFGEEK